MAQWPRQLSIRGITGLSFGESHWAGSDVFSFFQPHNITCYRARISEAKCQLATDRFRTVWAVARGMKRVFWIPGGTFSSVEIAVHSESRHPVVHEWNVFLRVEGSNWTYTEWDLQSVDTLGRMAWSPGWPWCHGSMRSWKVVAMSASNRPEVGI